MKKRILSMIMVVAVGFTILNPINARAEGLHDNEVISDDLVSDEIIGEEGYSEVNYNAIEHEVTEEFAVDENAFTSMASESAVAEIDNTNPNNAYVISNDTVWSGNIINANEYRWYAFQVSETSKATAFLQMTENLDADMYLFKMNEETMGLDIIGGSANDGAGNYEYFSNVLDEGIYFLAVNGYESVGTYSFMFFLSSRDAEYEVNDNAQNATAISFGTSMTGVIDTPLDYDFFKITLSQPAIIKYSMSSSDGYQFSYMGCDSENGHLYNIAGNNGYVKALAGTYYFAVYSDDTSNYSATSTYTVSFSKIGNMSTDSTVYLKGISEAAGIIFESNENGTVSYVNGNLVNINYSYVQNLSNSAGGQYYNITINPNAGEQVVYVEGYEPAAVYYHSSTKPAMHVSSRPALKLTYYCDNVFYRVNCWGTGAYSMNTFRQDFNVVTVLVDPESGNLIDIVEFNYYYDFAPVGTNYITWTSPYTMTLY